MFAYNLELLQCFIYFLYIIKKENKAVYTDCSVSHRYKDDINSCTVYKPNKFK